jgi:serine/threonine protein phosphatase PrpC
MTTSGPDSVTATTMVGCATEQGPDRQRNADAYATAVFHNRLAAAIVDGAGRKPAAAELAPLAAEAATRVAARRTPVWGVMSAAELCADPSVGVPAPSAAIVVATAEDEGIWRIAWAGDSAAWTMRDGVLNKVTISHTEGEEMRRAGQPEEEARRFDSTLTNSLARVPVRGVSGTVARGELLILTSDGVAVPKRLPTETLQALIVEHHGDPQACAELVVRAAREAGSVDDITVMILHHPYTTAKEVNR